MDLNHIQLNTTNLDSAVSFYSKYFDFAIQKKHGEGYFLWNDSGFMMAINPLPEAPKFPNWFHIGFRLNTSVEVRELYETMQDDKCKIIAPLDVSDDFIFFRVEDPSGYTVEIFWEPTPQKFH